MPTGQPQDSSVRRVPFTLFPAVDVADGRAIRLVQGKGDAETEPCDPLTAALDWQSAGASWIHLVDLDAAFGRGSNAEFLASIIDRTQINVQLSGGISDDGSLTAALATDSARVVLSTVAVQNLDWCERVLDEHGDRIAVALDVALDPNAEGQEKYRLSPRGRPTDTTAPASDLLETLDRLDRAGCQRYVVTDVSRDGMLSGPNVGLYRLVTQESEAMVIASGGVSTLEDLTMLADIERVGGRLEGAVIGKALYADQFTLTQAFDAVEGCGHSNLQASQRTLDPDPSAIDGDRS